VGNAPQTGGAAVVVGKTLFGLFNDYFRVYLPKLKKSSEHTIRSYRTAIDSLLEFVKTEKQISLAEVTLEMIDTAMISKYLNKLEEQGNSLTTRNLRLNCIKAFYAYASDVNTEAIIHASEISKIPKAAVPKYQKIDYLSENAMNVLLEQPNLLTKKGRRDRFFMLLMYDMGARLQEIRELKLCNINWGKTIQAALHGKGNKERLVPITRLNAAELETYMKEFHPNPDKYDKNYLFYVIQRSEYYPISDSAARKLVRKYGEAAKKICPEIPDIVHPHMLRHSRAMHLYQNGNDLTLIQQWLGHVNMETTLVYAYADTEHKRKAIEASIDTNSPLAKRRNAERFTLSDDETVKQLYGLV
jgi:site-specific recombinase XerD